MYGGPLLNTEARKDMMPAVWCCAPAACALTPTYATACGCQGVSLTYLLPQWHVVERDVSVKDRRHIMQQFGYDRWKVYIFQGVSPNSYTISVAMLGGSKYRSATCLLPLLEVLQVWPGPGGQLQDG